MKENIKIEEIIARRVPQTLLSYHSGFGWRIVRVVLTRI